MPFLNVMKIQKLLFMLNGKDYVHNQIVQK